MSKDNLKALVMIFEGCEGKRGVHARLLQESHINSFLLLFEDGLECTVLILRDMLEYELCTALRRVYVGARLYRLATTTASRGLASIRVGKPGITNRSHPVVE